MDAIDQKIIQLLGEDGRMAYAELARHVSLSTPAVHRRVRILEQRGVIAGFSVRVGSAALGNGLLAMVAIDVKSSLDDLIANLQAMREIEACWTTAGTADILLKVRTASPDAMERLLMRIRALPGVERTRATMLLATRFDREPDPAVLLRAADERV